MTPVKALFFGGAFNPPTVAHLEGSNAARIALHAEKVIFVPAKSHYILQTEEKEFSFSDAARLAMLTALAKTRPWMVVSALELEAKSQPRTYDSMQMLAKQGYDLTLVIGSDWLSGLEKKWRHVPEIARTFGIAVLSRNSVDSEAIVNADSYLRTLKPYLTFIETPETNQNLSSSIIRKALRDGTMTPAIRAMIPPELDDLKAYYSVKETV